MHSEGLSLLVAVSGLKTSLYEISYQHESTFRLILFQSEERKIPQSQSKPKLKTSKFSKARENASEQVVIGFSFDLIG